MEVKFFFIVPLIFEHDNTYISKVKLYVQNVLLRIKMLLEIQCIFKVLFLVKLFNLF